MDINGEHVWGNYQYCDECSGDQAPEAHCKNVKVRRNVKTLSIAEKERLVNALNRLVHNGRYKEVGNIHGAPTTICPNEDEGYCCPHGTVTRFLPWHRLYMAQMEEELGEPLPYWNWTEDSEIPDLWEGIRAPLKEGIAPRLLETHNECGGGPYVIKPQNLRVDTEALTEKTRDAFITETFRDFTSQISDPHNFLHRHTGCDMVTTQTSGYVPFFYLHHAYVDYQWAFWQELQKLRGINEPPLEEFDQENPPFNRAGESHCCRYTLYIGQLH